MIRRLIAVSTLTFLAGCSDALPAVKPPSFDSAVAAQAALAESDSNGDGVLSKAEAVSGMRTYWKRYDHNGDGSASLDEITARFHEWTNGDTGMMNLRVEVRFRGNPLPQARIEMTPYEFFGGELLPAKGKTDPYGYAFMAIPKDLLPDSQKGTHGMQVGLYKVAISHSELQLPARYNDDTELSVDLSSGDSITGVRFELK